MQINEGECQAMLLCATVPDTETTFVDDLERELEDAHVKADWIIVQSRGLLYLFLRSSLRAVGIIRRFRKSEIIPINEGIDQSIHNRSRFIDLPEDDGDENLSDLELARNLIDEWTRATWEERPDDAAISQNVYVESFKQEEKTVPKMRRRARTQPMSSDQLSQLLGIGDGPLTNEDGDEIEMVTISSSDDSDDQES